jgi:hypothetical protein
VSYKGAEYIAGLEAELERVKGELMALSQDDGKVERALVRSEEQLAALTATNARLESAIQFIGNELSLHGAVGPAGDMFRSLLNPTTALADPDGGI